MPIEGSAFRHHPELVDRVIQPEDSFFRTFDYTEIDARLAEIGMSRWRRPDDDREADRRKTLDARPGGDLWVFAYASLMWDPGIQFDELRRAHSPAHGRKFNLLDILGRGSPDCPGLQSTLDHGEGCTGYALRIPADLVEAESGYLWKREMISYGYIPDFIALETAQGPVTALAFLANHGFERVQDDLGFDTQVRMIATGKGLLGACRDNIENLALHLEELGIEDPHVFALRDAVRAFPGGG